MREAQLHHRHKREIGKYAAGLVEDGQVVYLDAGTTTFEIARSLAERFNLTVVTNDFSIIQHLMNRPQLSLFHTGGQVDQRNYSCVGNSAAMLLRSLNIDVAFISTSSWDLEHGLSTPHEEKVLVKQALLEVARRRVLVSDSSKYGKYGMFRVCPLEALSDIICDAALPPEAQCCASAVCNCTTSNSDNNNARERSTICRHHRRRRFSRPAAGESAAARQLPAGLRHADPGGHHPAARPLPDTRLQCLALDLSARRGGAADRCRLRRAVPPGSHRQQPCGERFRSRHAGQFRRHPPIAGSGAPPAPGMKFIFTSSLAVFGGVAAGDRRSECGHPAILLRRAEGDVRATDQRLCAQRLRRWPRAAPAHHQRAAGQAEQGGIVVRQRHHPRAAAR